MFGFNRKKDAALAAAAQEIETGVDKAHQVRLEQAENDLHSLKARANRAISTLDARQGRNHWRESIQQMIQGGI